MKYLSRPYTYVQLALAAGLGAVLVAAPPGAQGQSGPIIDILQEPSPLLAHSSNQGYLGVLVSDVDNESAAKLKLKEVRGAVITLIDHDAPAGTALRVNDVVLQLNGQTVEGAEQFGRMLREIPPGRKVSIVISRDGSVQTIGVQLVDHKAMAHDVWNKMNSGDVFPAPTGMGILGGGGDATLPGWHMPFVGSSLKVGAMVEPLTSQMADYVGVASAIMVKQVARKSEAAAAGLKAFDVIVKVGADTINTTSDWDRALRANEGKQVQVTILRDRKQQIITLQVDSKHRSDVHYEDLFPAGSDPMVAELTGELGTEFAADAAAAAENLRNQAEALKAEIGPQQLDEFKKQAEKLRESFNSDAFANFTVDPGQLDEFKQQMEDLAKDLKADDFKIEPKQMDELKQRMEEFRRQFKADDFKIDPKQMEELKRRMEEMRKTMPQMLMDRHLCDPSHGEMVKAPLSGIGNRV